MPATAYQQILKGVPAIDKPVVIGGSMVAGYFNKFASGGGQVIPMEIHPYLPAGTLLMQTEWLVSALEPGQRGADQVPPRLPRDQLADPQPCVSI
jgi:hypothetical protein